MQLNKKELEILEDIKLNLYELGVLLPDMDHEIVTAALFAFKSFIRDSISKPHEGEKKNDA